MRNVGDLLQLKRPNSLARPCEKSGLANSAFDLRSWLKALSFWESDNGTNRTK